MPPPKLLLTAPLHRISRRVRVAGGDEGPWRATTVETELGAEVLEVASAATRLGAEVTAVVAAEPSVAADLRSALEGLGASVELIEVGSASLAHTRYVDADDAVRFEVMEGAPPSTDEVDRLLDRLGRRLEDEPDFAVVAGDLEGGPRRDFAERVVGRAWGLGVRTILVPNGASLKQAFHTQPFAARVDADELLAVSPPDEGVEETQEETLARIFLDPVRLLYVRRGDGMVLAAARAGTRELGRPEAWRPAALLGAFAALAARCGDDYLAAGVEAFEAVSRSDAAQPAS
ncbi:MAG: hypothetical protein ACF8XB_17555 [Planctomycetota bacterium JB042]